jgi:DNA helicase-2/ATP-dependent DNA helicase PcrA
MVDNILKNLLQDLNEEQKKAVTFEDGPLLIVAGAGTGKTTVITKRLAWLVLSGKAKTDQILTLTFTDKAAGEMEERIDKLLPYGYLDLWVSTFHAFAERVLKDNALEIGIPNDFKLLNQTEQWLLVRQNLERFKLDYYRPLGNPTKFIHALIKHFSRAKDEAITPAEYLEYVENLKLNTDSTGFIKDILDEEMRKTLSKKELKELAAEEIKKLTEVANAYHIYQQLLLENSALDFGDLVDYCLKLFKERPLILNKYRQQFKYILVDEFQDTNWAQYELIKILAAPKNNLTVVGDDDQCLPGEALISLPKGKKAIKNLKKGDEVLTGIGRSHIGISKISRVIKNKKEVRFLEIKTKSGEKIKVTDNHKMFIYLPNYSTGNFFVYLMKRQDIGYRIGITNSPVTRLRLERSSDSILLLASFKTEKEARYYETYYSLKYGIPTSCFMERKGIVIDANYLNKLYNSLNVGRGSEKLAQDLKKDLNFHHFYLNGVFRGGKSRVKINLEICSRKHRIKNLKQYSRNYEALHSLNLETSDPEIIRSLQKNGFYLTKAKKGFRFRKTSTNLKLLIDLADKLRKITGGLLQENFKIATLNKQSLPAIVVPAKNLVEGLFIPIQKEKKLIYDEIIEIKESYSSKIVYDLEIEKTHNFLANNVVVHNSIYKFRGASVSNILEFKEDFPKAKEIFLNRNYRSLQSILDLSYDFIKQNDPNRLEAKLNKNKKFSKKLLAENDGKALIEHFHVDSSQDEVKTILKQIVDLKNKDKDATWNDFAILVRANDSATPFIFGLAEAGIPFQFIASRGLYAKPIILDIMAYLKLLDNYHESPALFRMLNLPIFGFSHQEIINLNYWSNRKGWSLYESLVQSTSLKLDPETQEKIKKILGFIDSHSRLAREGSVSQIIFAFLEDTGYLKELTKKDDLETSEATRFLNQFFKKIEDFENSFSDKSVKNFLSLIELEIEAGEEGSLDANPDEGPESVKIMTMHAAKGLEFYYVFIPVLVDRRFPTIERKDPIELPSALIKEIIPEGDIHLEEERRLFYVAMTRAKKGLFFSSAEDYGGQRKKKISRFLCELKDLGLAVQEKSQIKEPTLFKEKTEKIKKEFKENELEIILPQKFSFTQLKAFDNCPYQYRFAHVLRVPVRGKPVFSFGKTIHSTLQKFFAMAMERGNFDQRDIFGDPSGGPTSHLEAEPPKKLKIVEKNIVSEKELMEIFENSWIDDWYTTRKSQDEYKDKGRKLLKEFYAGLSDKYVLPKYLEKGFNLKIQSNGEEYTLKGVMDRVDEVEDGIEIIDYKTGEGKEEDKLKAEDKEQLLIYQMAANEVMQEKVASLSFYYVEPNRKVSFLGSNKELEKLKEKIIKTIEEIKKGEFPPKPSQLCKYCDFNRICEYRQL